MTHISGRAGYIAVSLLLPGRVRPLLPPTLARGGGGVRTERGGWHGGHGCLTLLVGRARAPVVADIEQALVHTEGGEVGGEAVSADL